MDNIMYIIQPIICVCAIYFLCKCCLSSNNNVNNDENHINHINHINSETETSYLTPNNLPKYSKIDTLLNSNNNYESITISSDLPKYDDIV